MGFGFEVLRDGIDGDEVGASVVAILEEARLVTLATSGPRGPHASPVFFAVDDDLAFYFVSERTTRHTAGLTSDDRMSGAAFLEPPVYGEQLRGVQLHGTAQEVEPGQRGAALAIYRGRFPDFARDDTVQEVFRQGKGPAGLYRFLVEEVTVLDEPRFGRRVYVPARVRR